MKYGVTELCCAILSWGTSGFLNSSPSPNPYFALYSWHSYCRSHYLCPSEIGWCDSICLWWFIFNSNSLLPVFLLLEIKSVTVLLAGRATWEMNSMEKGGLSRICKAFDEFGAFWAPRQRHVPFLVASKPFCLCFCSVCNDLSTLFLKCSVTKFILMAWNSGKLLNTRRGCLPQEVWICSCWEAGREDWGLFICTLLNLVLSPGYMPLVMLEAGPWAKATPCRIESVIWERRSSLSLPAGGELGKEAFCLPPPKLTMLVTLCCGVSSPFFSCLIILCWPEVLDVYFHMSCGHVACGDGNDPARSWSSYK